MSAAIDGMKLYRICYTDADDFACPVFSMTVRAFNREHAEEKFFSTEDDGWRIVKIERAKVSA